MYLTFDDVTNLTAERNYVEKGDVESLIILRTLYWISGSYGLSYDDFCDSLPSPIKDFSGPIFKKFMKSYQKFVNLQKKPVFFLVDELRKLGDLSTFALTVLSSLLELPEGYVIFASSLLDETFREFMSNSHRKTVPVRLPLISSLDELLAPLLKIEEQNSLSKFLQLQDKKGISAVKMLLWSLVGSPRLMNEVLFAARKLTKPLPDDALKGFEVLKNMAIDNAEISLPEYVPLKVLAAAFIQLPLSECSSTLQQEIKKMACKDSSVALLNKIPIISPVVFGKLVKGHSCEDEVFEGASQCRQLLLTFVDTLERWTSRALLQPTSDGADFELFFAAWIGAYLSCTALLRGPKIRLEIYFGKSLPLGLHLLSLKKLPCSPRLTISILEPRPFPASLQAPALHSLFLARQTHGAGRQVA